MRALSLTPAFGDDVDDVAPRHLLPVVAVWRRPSTPTAHCRSFAGSSGVAHMKWRARRVAHRLGEQATIREVASGAPRRLVARHRARPNSRSCSPHASLGCAQPAFQPNASAIDWIAWARATCAKFLSAQNMRSRKRTESERASCPRSPSRGTAVAERAARSARPPAAARHRRLGQERRRHDRLDRRSGHCVVEHGRVLQRVGPVADRIRQARVATRRASRAVVLVARTRRHRAGERLDATALDVDQRDRGHAHLRVLEQAAADAAPRVLPPHDAERATDVVAAGVARGDALRERLQRRIDRDVDRKADVDRSAGESMRFGPSTAVGAGVRFRRRRRVKTIERAIRPVQRFERLQQRPRDGGTFQRSSSTGRSGVGSPARTLRRLRARIGGTAQLGTLAQAIVEAARPPR